VISSWEISFRIGVDSAALVPMLLWSALDGVFKPEAIVSYLHSLIFVSQVTSYALLRI
jgi:hypothetical protein